MAAAHRRHHRHRCAALFLHTVMRAAVAQCGAISVARHRRTTHLHGQASTPHVGTRAGVRHIHDVAAARLPSPPTFVAVRRPHPAPCRRLPPPPARCFPTGSVSPASQAATAPEAPPPPPRPASAVSQAGADGCQECGPGLHPSLMPGGWVRSMARPACQACAAPCRLESAAASLQPIHFGLAMGAFPLEQLCTGKQIAQGITSPHCSW